jgi:hypothetical protein
MLIQELPNQKQEWPKIADAVLFIRKQEKGLQGWSDGQIVQAILRGIKEAAFAWSKNAAGEIDGIGFGYWKDRETLHATYLAGRSRAFINHVKEVHPGCKRITAIREGREVIYNLEPINI